MSQNRNIRGRRAVGARKAATAGWRRLTLAGGIEWLRAQFQRWWKKASVVALLCMLFAPTIAQNLSYWQAKMAASGQQMASSVDDIKHNTNPTLAVLLQFNAALSQRTPVDSFATAQQSYAQTAMYAKIFSAYPSIRKDVEEAMEAAKAEWDEWAIKDVQSLAAPATRGSLQKGIALAESSFALLKSPTGPETLARLAVKMRTDLAGREKSDVDALLAQVRTSYPRAVDYSLVRDRLSGRLDDFWTDDARARIATKVSWLRSAGKAQRDREDEAERERRLQRQTGPRFFNPPV